MGLYLKKLFVLCALSYTCTFRANISEALPAPEPAQPAHTAAVPDAVKHAISKLNPEDQKKNLNDLYADFNTLLQQNSQQPLTTVPYKLIHITTSDFNNSANKKFILVMK